MPRNFESSAAHEMQQTPEQAPKRSQEKQRSPQEKKALGIIRDAHNKMEAYHIARTEFELAKLGLTEKGTGRAIPAEKKTRRTDRSIKNTMG
jgi:hypothetical protein